MDALDNWIGTEEIPLRYAEGGQVIRVGKTRVPIDTVIGEYKDGKTPEAIVHSFTSLELADVYLVIGYYLRHRQEVDLYLQEREEAADEIQHTIESQPGYVTLREKFAERRKLWEKSKQEMREAGIKVDFDFDDV